MLLTEIYEETVVRSAGLMLWNTPRVCHKVTNHVAQKGKHSMQRGLRS